MKTEASNIRSFEFCFPQLDTLVLVERSDDRVLIRATRDTFSADRKERFIRELAAEGFIPDEFQWFSSSGPVAARSVRWLVDFHWLKPNATLAAHTRRMVVGLFVSATLLWMLLLILLLSGGLQRN